MRLQLQNIFKLDLIFVHVKRLLYFTGAIQQGGVSMLSTCTRVQIAGAYPSHSPPVYEILQWVKFGIST